MLSTRLKLRHAIVVATVGVATSASAAVIEPLYDLSPTGSTGRNNYTGDLGIRFATHPTDLITITALGFYDAGGDGLASSHVVELRGPHGDAAKNGDYSGASDLLTSVVVPAGSVSPLVGGFRYVQLDTPVTITNNANFTLTAKYVSGDGDNFLDPYVGDGGAGNMNFNPEIVYGGGPRNSNYSFGRWGLGAGQEAYDRDGYVGPNLQAAVPEPAMGGMVSATAVLLMKRRRR